MSENTVDTVDTNGSTTTRTLTDAELLQFLQLKQAQEKRDAKAAEAKEIRKRANGRPIDPETGREMPAQLAFLQVQATFLKNWLDTYAGDPAKLAERLRESYLPVITNLASTPSIMMASAYDNNRRTLTNLMVPVEVQPTKK